MSDGGCGWVGMTTLEFGRFGGGLFDYRYTASYILFSRSFPGRCVGLRTEGFTLAGTKELFSFLLKRGRESHTKACDFPRSERAGVITPGRHTAGLAN